MTGTGKSDKLITQEGYVKCPACRTMKLLRLTKDGKAKCFAYCRHCKKEQFVNIDLSLSQ